MWHKLKPEKRKYVRGFFRRKKSSHHYTDLDKKLRIGPENSPSVFYRYYICFIISFAFFYLELLEDGNNRRGLYSGSSRGKWDIFFRTSWKTTDRKREKAIIQKRRVYAIGSEPRARGCCAVFISRAIQVFPYQPKKRPKRENRRVFM